MQWWFTITAFLSRAVCCNLLSCRDEPRQVPRLTSWGCWSGNLTWIIPGGSCSPLVGGRRSPPTRQVGGREEAQLGRLQFNIFWMLCYAVVNLHDRPRYKWLLFSAGGRREESSHQAGRWVGGREGGPTWEASHPSQSSQCRLAWKVSATRLWNSKLAEFQVGRTPIASWPLGEQKQAQVVLRVAAICSG